MEIGSNLLEFGKYSIVVVSIIIIVRQFNYFLREAMKEYFSNCKEIERINTFKEHTSSYKELKESNKNLHNEIKTLNDEHKNLTNQIRSIETKISTLNKT